MVSLFEAYIISGLIIGAIIWSFYKHWVKVGKDLEKAKEEKESEKIMRELEAAARQQIREEKEALRPQIVNLLKEKGGKISVSDIDAFLKNNNLEMTKDVCKALYKDGEISFAGQGRYFVLTEGKEKPKKTSAPKSEEVDVKKELEKFKVMLDKGLINQEDYDAKKKELLGL